jgi:predicted DNA-binding ribbon-helix-helix protein
MADQDGRKNLGPVKRSVTLNGHRTSLTMEPAFWDALDALAQNEGIGLSALVARIDESRGAVGLSAAVRVYILGAYRARAMQAGAAQGRADKGSGGQRLAIPGGSEAEGEGNGDGFDVEGEDNVF